MRSSPSIAFSFTACLAVFLGAAEGPAGPEIQSAERAGSVLTITGTGFGTKPQAKPYFYQPFRDTQEGSGIETAGFDVSGGNNARSEYNTISMSDGVAGGSILHMAPCLSDSRVKGESFHHTGKTLPPETDEAFASCWVKLTRVSDTTGKGLIQIKGIRMAPADGASGGVGMYKQVPKFAFSVFLQQDMQVRGNNIYWWGSEDRTERRTPGHKPRPSNPQKDYDDVWVSWEAYYRLNDIGQANGIQEIHIGGKPEASATTASLKKLPDEHLGFVQFSPGITNGSAGSDWQFRLSHCYIDTTRARIFLGDAGQLEACNGRFPIPATSWSETALEADLEQRPEGYDWLYVCTADGAINPHGFSLPEDQ